MTNIDTDALAVWTTGFFALAVVSGLIAVAALVTLMRSSRSAGAAPVSRGTTRLPVLAGAGTSSADRAA